MASFGFDPMDRFSSPISSSATPLGLGNVYVFPVRALKEKPGRAVMVLSDDREPFIHDFKNAYSYINTFWKNGNSAGNHYHKRKNEIFTVIHGEVNVYLQSVEDSTQIEGIYLCAAKENEKTVKRLYIPAGVAHLVFALSSPAILHVVATSPGTKDDEFEFVVSKK